MSTRIYIPTLRRIGLNLQTSLREFLDKSSYIPVLVCPPDELSKHKKYHKHVVACDAQGIGPTRQWILDNSPADLVIMVDDDMYFQYRPDPEKIKLEVCQDLDPLIEHIETLVWDAGFIHGGVGARQGNNRKDCSTPRNGWIKDGHLYQDNERVNNFHFMNRWRVKEAGARFDRLPVMEDFHFTLTLLTKGYPNMVIHDYVWNQRGSGAIGGCSEYRTPEIQAEGAEGLQAAFPEFVSVVTKVSKDTSPCWKDFKERKDVRVQWLKAFQSAGS